MQHYKAQPADSQTSSAVAIDIIDVQTNRVLTTIRHSAPEGFPENLLPYLAQFMALGFNAEPFEEIKGLEEFADSGRGRPLEPEVENEARDAARLRKECPDMSWREIARKVCRHRSTPRHECDKSCADRIEKAAKDAQGRDEIEQLRHRWK